MSVSLVCEVCGGKLIGKPGGVFDCDSCGIEYSTEWARNKIQEIKGSVAIEGIANKGSLLRRGELALEDNDWSIANEYFEKVLDIDPESAEAYLGKVCSDLKQENVEMLGNLEISRYHDLPDYRKAVRFAEADLKIKLNGIEASSQKQEQILAEQFEKNKLRLSSILEKHKSVQKMIAVGNSSHTSCAIHCDGTALLTYRYGRHFIDGWTDIVAVAAGFDQTVGLTADGTVLVKSTSRNESLLLWTDIIDITTDFNDIYGLKADGSVLTTNNKLQYSLAGWRDIVSIAAGQPGIFGIRSDGTVVAQNQFYGELSDTSTWKNIMAIAVGASNNVVVGLKADGTVVGTIVGYRPVESVDDDKLPKTLSSLANWHDIVAVEILGRGVLGLTSDRTAIYAGQDSNQFRALVSDWTDVVSISAKDDNFMCIKANGGVLSIEKWDKYGRYERYEQEPVTEVRPFMNFDSLEEDRKKAQETAARRRENEAAIAARQAALNEIHKKISELQNERARLGLFDGKQKKEIDAQIASLNTKIRTLSTP